jgi:hypothetical protein
MSASQSDNNHEWYDVLYKWFEKWVKTYKTSMVDAYDILNRELIPTRQYERALVWCLYIFDVTVLTHQMVSLVRETDGREIGSVYHMPIDGLVDVLRRLENQMIQCRSTFDELLTLNAIDRMYTVSAAAAAAACEHNPSSGGDDPLEVAPPLPMGVTSYTPDRRHADLMADLMELNNDTAAAAAADQQLVDLAATLELLRAGSDRQAVRAENLDKRLPPSDVRAIFMIVAPGDGELARTLAEAYLAELKNNTIGGGGSVKIYRVDYGGLLSKWRGESEKNFENLMQWMVERARQNAKDGRGFDALWFDNVHVLMGQRGGGGGGGGGAEDFLAVIKTTMLQIMDVFNKDRRLSRFALVFSTGARQAADVDSAFRRRMDSVYELPPLSRSPSLRKLMIRHALRITRLNVEGDALASLNAVENASALQSLIYSFYVHARFVIGTEFNLVKPGTPGYSLRPLETYYNLNGEVVRTGSQDRVIMQAVQSVVTGGDHRYFYRPGEIDPRNLPKDLADNTVYLISTMLD